MRNFGLRRQAERDAALEKIAPVPITKALSTLRSAGAVQKLPLIPGDRCFRVRQPQPAK